MTRIDTTAWAAFEPTPDDPWDLRKVAHLHRRAGFGATRAELERDVAAGPAESVGRLLNPPEPSEEEKAVCDGLRAGAVGSSDPRRLRAYWLYRMLFGGDPLRERLTLFWHGHFATSLTKVDSVTALSAQVETLRRAALGGFAGLLEAMIADAAMLVWLDGGTSRRERPNENFAREYLELFTLGQGAYTEQRYPRGRPRLHRLGVRGGIADAQRLPTRGSPSTTRLTTLAPRRSWARPARGRPPTSCGSRSNAPRPRGTCAQALPRVRGRGTGARTRADRAPGRCSAVKRLFDPARDGHDLAVEAFLLESVVSTSHQVARRVHGRPAADTGGSAPEGQPDGGGHGLHEAGPGTLRPTQRERLGRRNLVDQQQHDSRTPQLGDGCRLGQS